jgi:hypothetical protein
MKRALLAGLVVLFFLFAGCDIRKDVCESVTAIKEINESYVEREPYTVLVEYEDCLGRPAKYNIESQDLAGWDEQAGACSFALAIANPEDNPATYEIFVDVKVGRDVQDFYEKTTVPGHERTLIKFDVACNESDEVSLEGLDVEPSTINDCRKKQIKTRNETRYNNVTRYRLVNKTTTEQKCRKQSWKEAFFGND